MKVEIKKGFEVYYDKWLHDQFVLVRDKVIRQDFDWISFLDGVEGGGKSTLGQQLAGLCDPDFCIERICFTHKEFIDAVMKAKQYQAIVFDEAYGSVASKDAIGKVCKTITDLLAQIRQKNLFLFIISPTFFDIVRNVALWRSRVLIHVYLGPGYKRGFWRAFTYNKKNKLYILGKKLYNYSAVPQSAYGRFTKKLVVDEQEYRKKKLVALEHFQEREERRPDVYNQRDVFLKYLHNKYGYDAKKIMEILTNNDLSMSPNRIREIFRKTTTSEGETYINT